MKIYTKKGDTGKTGLIGGTRVSKHSIRIDAYGTVDELNAHIGMLRDQQINPEYVAQLIEIQDRLFTIGSHLAQDPEKTSMALPEIKENDVTQLEDWIDAMESQLPPMKFFILPGGHPTVSACHITRCVCRRAERIMVELHELYPIEMVLLSYVNRLSDYFFVLGRKLAQDLDAQEQAWHPKM